MQDNQTDFYPISIFLNSFLLLRTYQPIGRWCIKDFPFSFPVHVVQEKTCKVKHKCSCATDWLVWAVSIHHC